MLRIPVSAGGYEVSHLFQILVIREAEVSKTRVILRGNRDRAPEGATRHTDPDINAVLEHRVGPVDRTFPDS